MDFRRMNDKETVMAGSNSGVLSLERLATVSEKKRKLSKNVSVTSIFLEDAGP